MNRISHLAKVAKNIKIGKNNIIHDNVTINDDVIIGDNNQIFSGTVIYPNTKIGNNNVFLNNNIIGEHAVEAKYNFTEKKFAGLEIGNNNYFHINNLIFNGYHNKTIIGNNNKLLAENHIGHDAKIHNNVHLYPRCLVGGTSILQSNSGMGTGSYLQQRLTVGEFAFTAMNNAIVKNCFPFLIYINNKPFRMNKHRILKEYHIYEQVILELANQYHNKESIKNNIIRSVLPTKIKISIQKFID